MMKKIILLFMAMTVTAMLLAQDIILTIDSTMIEAKVVEISSKQVIYKDLSVENSPLYELPVSKILSVQLSNGIVKTYEPNKEPNEVPNLANPSQIHISKLYCQGSRYFYDGKMMKGEAYTDFLKNNCEKAYDLHLIGHRMSISGWCLFGVSLVSAAAVPLSAYLCYDNSLFITLGAISTVAFVASVPVLTIGYSKKHKAIDIFNTMEPQAYWSINASQNGIGLALNF